MNAIAPHLAVTSTELTIGVVLGVILLIGGFIIVSFFSIWLRALLAGAPVGFPTLVAMRLRGVPACGYRVM